MIKDGIVNIDNKITSFLMIGQSNMAGRGDLSDVPQIENDLCFMLRMGMWQKMSEPINYDKSKFAEFECGVSPAASFADCVAKHTKTKVGLIPCAVGGSAISQWQPGEIMFDHAVFMTELAKRTSNFGGIIWHQGESDCGAFDPDYYRKAFLETMTELRKALGAENLPLIIGELSENISDSKYHLGDNPKKMNMLLFELSRELPHCELVSAQGLTLRQDGIHFDAASCREMGRRYFEKYLLLREK